MNRKEKEFVEDFYGVYNDCEYIPSTNKRKRLNKKKDIKNYYPVLIKDNTDDAIDHVILVNNSINSDEFDNYVQKAIQKLHETDYDYDGAYWEAICKFLPKDLDFYTYNQPTEIYY